MNRKLWTIIGLCTILVVGGALGIIINNVQTRFRPFAAPVDGITTISGNGGNAVMAGPYLFFAGNFVSTASITYRQNEHNRVEYGGIFRLRMGVDGTPQYDNQFLRDRRPDLFTDDMLQAYFGDEWNSRPDWDLRPIVPKIAGFERTAIWVFGNYLVYTSPNNNQNRFGVLQRDRLDFFRVDLTGANHRRIFTSESDRLSADDFTVTRTGAGSHKRTHLLVRDGARIVRVNVCTNPGQQFEITNRATSHAFPIQHTFDNQTYRAMNPIMSYVFFTETREDGSHIQGNLLKRFRLTTNEAPELLSDIADRNFETLTLTGNNLLFTMTDINTPNSRWLFLASDDRLNDNAGVSRFAGEAALERNFLVTRIFQPEDNFFLANEIVSPALGTRFLSHHGTSISVFTRNAQGIFTPQRMSLPYGVASIINVGASHIHLLTSDDRVLVVDWLGNIPPRSTGAITMENRTPNSMNVSVFSRIDHEGRFTVVGNALSEMFFYMQTITSRYDGSSITMATIVDSNGRAWRLGGFPEDFFNEPDDVIVDEDEDQDEIAG